MTDDLLTDQQQAERFRDWFRENGLFLAAGLVLGLGGLFGWNWWQSSQRMEAERASVLYEVLLDAARAQNLDDTEALLAELEREAGSSPYVDQGRLALARLHLDRNEPDEATAALRRVAEEGRTETVRNIARLRLARVLIHEGEAQQALDVLGPSVSEAFAAARHDVRGDAYYALDDREAARREYRQALDLPDANGMLDRGFVEAKLDDLAPPPSAGDDAGTD